MHIRTLLTAAAMSITAITTAGAQAPPMDMSWGIQSQMRNNYVGNDGLPNRAGLLQLPAQFASARVLWACRLRSQRRDAQPLDQSPAKLLLRLQ
jgi:hypothetical protein